MVGTPTSPPDGRTAIRGEMAARFAHFDWSSTSIGPPARWPQSWRHAIRILLDSSFPACVGLGPQLCFFYNDAYIPIGGPARHPSSIGQPVQQVWKEIWDDVIVPRFRHTLGTGEPTGGEDFMFLLERSGYLEETYISFSYAALRDDEGRPNGIFCTSYETTARVVAERHIECLRALAARSSVAETPEAACHLAAEILAKSPRDLPFALLYLLNANGSESRLASTTGLGSNPRLVPQSIDLRAEGAAPFLKLARVVRLREPAIIEDLGALHDAVSGSGRLAPTCAIATPIRGGEQVAGILVAGVNPLRPLSESLAFHGLVANHLETAIANARAKQLTRERAEALAEIDRAKTTFFSNVSHEFRTPLTLLLAPLHDVLSRGALAPAERSALEMARRAADRLLKLVNSLLEFSRIEAGRVQAVYQPTDLAALTRSLASVFRSAFERAGVKLTVDCVPLPAPVYVDNDMWEKIVLNLISNAFKFTLEGEVWVRQKLMGDHVQLEIADTGCGIDAQDLPHLFERFHRGRAGHARTHEGSGIGLSLVHELVKLHGGSVEVMSEVSRGTTLIVRIPCGNAHLPADRLGGPPTLARTEIGALPFVEEARGWLPDALAPPDETPRGMLDRDVPRRAEDAQESSAYILVADDNADMRDYLQQLLGSRWEIAAAPDGAAALERLRQRLPDLLIADVMMPRLDGFGLLRAMRADARTATVPVMLLSARAGEEAMEGLSAGAEDYLIKPFAARELIARVESRLAQVRLRVAERLARESAEEANRAKDEFLATLSHELRQPLMAIQGWMDVLRHGLAGREALHALDIIEHNTLAQRRLIDDLLDTARIVTGRFSVELEHIGTLEPLIAPIVESFRPAALHKGIQLDFTSHANGGGLRGDPQRLRQVISNLLSNAITLTPAGGRVAVRCGCTPQRFELTVSDSGPGIGPEEIPHVFERFWRASATASTRPGLGLGLAIAHQIVSLHGGQITIASDGAGRGASFTVSLPMEASHARATSASPSSPAPITTHAKHILLVDDDEDIGKAYARLLASRGYRVTRAAGIAAALAAVNELNPNILICDLTLEDGTGFDLLERMRPRLESRGAPGTLTAIAIGGSGASDRDACLAAGFATYLPKPFDISTLLETLQQIGTPDRVEP